MQLDHSQLRDLIALLGDSDIQELKLEGDDFRLELRRNLPAAQTPVVMQAAPAMAAPVAPAPMAAAPSVAPPAAPAASAACRIASRRFIGCPSAVHPRRDSPPGPPAP